MFRVQKGGTQSVDVYNKKVANVFYLRFAWFWDVDLGSCYFGCPSVREEGAQMMSRSRRCPTSAVRPTYCGAEGAGGLRRFSNERTGAVGGVWGFG